MEAITVAKYLTREMFFRFSPPEALHSDQGCQFDGLLLKKICRILQIRKSRTSPYHPQCDGLVERLNRTLLSMLATSAKDNPLYYYYYYYYYYLNFTDQKTEKIKNGKRTEGEARFGLRGYR